MVAAPAAAPVAVQSRAMAWIAGGTFRMGDERFYPEEAPVRQATVDGFWIDTCPVTNTEFAIFVAATGHVTLAERVPDAAAYPGVHAAALKPGSAVFRQPRQATSLRRAIWWAWVEGADWRHPEGPGSSLDGRWDHPVVHVAHEDAAAYAAWCGKALPSEAQWECAARGGLHGAAYAWGDEAMPGGRLMANIWRGRFPHENLRGAPGTEAVGRYPPNGHGLHDMIGNVWEWTATADGAVAQGCCGTGQGPRRFVVKGGSFLCADNFCRRYRPAARQGQPADSSAAHIGFRCVRAA